MLPALAAQERRCGAVRIMDTTRFLDDLQQRINQMLAGTPAADIQKNLKALLTQQFARLDLVTREEIDTQAQVLAIEAGGTLVMDEGEMVRAADKGGIAVVGIR